MICEISRINNWYSCGFRGAWDSHYGFMTLMLTATDLDPQFLAHE